MTNATEREHRAVLAILARVQGPERPDTLLSCANLALVPQGQGEVREAEPFARRAYEAGRRVFREQPPYVSRLKALWEELQGVGWGWRRSLAERPF